MSNDPSGRTASITAPQDGEGRASVLDRLWDALLRIDEPAAVRLVLAEVEAGAPPERVLMGLVAPVQRRIGEAWAADRLSVAQEHAATAIADRAVAALAAHPAARTEESRGRVTVACVDGEWHALPARLVAEVLRLRGWHVDFLGAHVPTRHLVAHLHRTGPDAVALSSSLATRLPAAHAAITACQAAGVRVVVGGRAFGGGGRYAAVLGADGWAATAPEAAALLEAPRTSAAQAASRRRDRLPHLTDQEYSLISRGRTRLVEDALADLAERYPEMSSYTDEQHRHTADDLAHVAEHLACALYVDDAELFTAFLDWTARVLRARGVPGRALLLGVDALRHRLRDFPRATAVLAEAHDRLAGAAAAGTEPDA